ncbi:MAG: hypothetical protein KDC54_02875 [Lewinella sp.]|nr:hypothetical protein [Lewinella sp.]
MLDRAKTSPPESLIQTHERLRLLHAAFLQFDAPVTFERCRISALTWQSCHFRAAASFIECTFTGPVIFDCCDFEAALLLHGNQFNGFVNVYDGQFRAAVRISKNDFQAGSSLLGNQGQPFRNTFATPPILTDNLGNLAL